MEMLECLTVYCAMSSESAKPHYNLPNRNMCYFIRVIDADLPCTRDRLFAKSMHGIVVQEWNFALLPHLSSLNMTWRREASAEVNFHPRRSHILYIGHNPHANFRGYCA